MLVPAGRHVARAASSTWLGTVNNLWPIDGNWSATPVPGSGDTATFSNAGGPLDTIDLGPGITLGAMLFDTAAVDPYVIGAGGVNAQTLTLNNGGTITIAATVANGETINAAIVLGTDATAQAYTLTNNSAAATLAVAGSVVGGSGGTAGAKTLNIAGVGATSLSGIIGNGGAGSLGITKTGAGTLTLWGANTFNGAIAVNGGTLKAGITSVTNTSGAFGRNSAVTLANTAGVILDISGFDTQIGSLAGGGASGGNVSLGANTL
ncbi:MAG: PEP-CTERM sorting domain-containing protein, partial [Planctomycetia bacterium]|nr:PEP-CTERM sorting domain-containing protein [Planctomycetia bacterium]